MATTTSTLENLSFQDIAYDAAMSTNLRAIDVLAAGVLFVEDIEGAVRSYTFNTTTLNSSLPYRVHLYIRRIIGDGAGNIGDGATGTNIALANLIGLH